MASLTNKKFLQTRKIQKIKNPTTKNPYKIHHESTLLFSSKKQKNDDFFIVFERISQIFE